MNRPPLRAVWACVVLPALLPSCGIAEDRPAVETHAGQPCWVLRTAEVELAVTHLGGHMAPVTFYRDTDHPIQPYYISPWQSEGLRLEEPVLRPLRGDFFCMPFGADQSGGDQKRPAHGETASSPWTLVGSGKTGPVTSLFLSMTTRIHPGKVTKRLSLVDGQNVVYCRHVLEGFSGRMPLGHHATLAVPEAEGALRVATSPFEFGMTLPVLFSDPAKGEYQSFAINQRFRDLRHVPLLWKGPSEADCTSFPARTGFADLLAVFKRPNRTGTPAWMAVTNQQAGYLWFSLKDPGLLPSTVFWIENHGRHGVPWKGRNRCLGLEDVCAYFDRGLPASLRPNAVAEAGIPTSVELAPDRPCRVNYIQGVVKIPADFRAVQSAEFGPESVTFTSVTGKRVTAAVKHGLFLKTGEL